ncbi:MAG: polymer-forming cytoskeletal protein [Spirochaetaceae bacterium]|nr:polymer-forming cytoskeletal protein [Spirochaetaceae bacterium]
MNDTQNDKKNGNLYENIDDDDYDTILSEDIDFKGTLNFEKSFLIKGKMEGGIDARGILLVDTGAEVIADITADKVIIRGSVTGDVTARRKVEVTLTGKLVGNVHAPEIQMESGCVFNGLCRMEPVER